MFNEETEDQRPKQKKKKDAGYKRIFNVQCSIFNKKRDIHELHKLTRIKKLQIKKALQHEEKWKYSNNELQRRETLNVKQIKRHKTQDTRYKKDRMREAGKI